jgi:dihydrofolate synthase/folylpolyglutamate synthase
MTRPPLGALSAAVSPTDGPAMRSMPVAEIAPPAPVPAEGFANYPSALKYLNDRINIEKSRPSKVDPALIKLESMQALLGALGDPHRSVKCVHVAGSKGKGSTVEMTASCLAACGYAVGVYTSPHLINVRERVRINAEPIGHASFTQIMSKVALAAKKVEPQHGQPTFFEVLTALAFVYFAEQAVDIAVIETGLGGRLDSTNVIMPEVTAITAIQLEHTQILGDTLAKIAREKAGIFKPGVTALTVPQPREVIEVFREVAAGVGAELRVLGDDVEFSYRFEASPELGPHARVCLSTARSNFEHLPVPLKGEHQAFNCGLALAILDKLRERGFESPERHVAEGLARTHAAGRMEMAWASPRIIIDGAHNPESIHCLVKAIGAHVKYDSMVVVFGCGSDKDVPGMLAKMALGADKIIFTRAAGNARAMDPRELQRRFAEFSGKMTQVAKSLPEALEIAARAVGREDVICVTGSFYLAGEAKKYLQDLAAKRAGKK